MRQRKLDLPARVNGDLALTFGDVALTSYAGLELFGRYLRRTRFNAMVRDVFRGTPLRGAPPAADGADGESLAESVHDDHRRPLAGSQRRHRRTRAARARAPHRHD